MFDTSGTATILITDPEESEPVRAEYPNDVRAMVVSRESTTSVGCLACAGILIWYLSERMSITVTLAARSVDRSLPAIDSRSSESWVLVIAATWTSSSSSWVYTVHMVSRYAATPVTATAVPTAMAIRMASRSWSGREWNVKKSRIRRITAGSRAGRSRYLSPCG